MTMKKLTLIIAILIGAAAPALSGNNYKNFQVAVYARAYEVRKMDNLQWLEQIWNEIFQQVKVGKMYLETQRDQIIVDEKTIDKIPLISYNTPAPSPPTAHSEPPLALASGSSSGLLF